MAEDPDFQKGKQITLEQGWEKDKKKKKKRARQRISGWGPVLGEGGVVVKE